MLWDYYMDGCGLKRIGDAAFCPKCVVQNLKGHQSAIIPHPSIGSDRGMEMEYDLIMQ